MEGEEDYFELPVLDGDKVLLYLLEKTHNKFKQLHYPLAVTSWIFLIGLMVYVTVLDICKYIV